MARLQELQYTIRGGKKVKSCVNLSPRSSSYFPKQESLGITNANNSRRSPSGKMPTVNAADWRKMSLPAMLLGETMGEVLQATQFARNIVQAALSSSSKTDDPKTPIPARCTNSKTNVENSAGLMQARRKIEKQVVLHTIRSESNMPSARAKTKINFKTNRQECDKENCKYIANRISSRNRPWATKTVLFPNPLFHSSSPTSQHQKFSKTKSPVKNSRQTTPHKFLTKPPHDSASKFQVKIKSPPPIYISPIKKSQEAAATKTRRRSFSPSRLANRLISPLKSRKSLQKNEGMKFVEIERNRQTTYKFLIKSSPQGKIKSSLVSTSPTRITIWGKKSPSKAAKARRSFSPSTLANRIVMSPLRIRNKNDMNGNVDKYWRTRFSPGRI